MYKKILVPLDGSQRAEAILPHVEDLASRYQSTILLLQVVEPSIAYTSPYDVYPELSLEDAERRAEDVSDYLSNLASRFQGEGLSTQCHVGHGPVVTAILELANSEDVDLIAMASHGRTGLARVFYGSVAAGVLSHLDRPILLVRSQ
jgi:nucleotide-binding universal stress UspA family protein